MKRTFNFGYVDYNYYSTFKDLYCDVDNEYLQMYFWKHRKDDIIVVNKIFIYERFRNSGYGTKILTYLKSLNKDIYLHCSPIGTNNFNKDLKRLKAFYNKNNFKLINYLNSNICFYERENNL